jgi:hypothetical protein
MANQKPAQSANVPDICISDFLSGGCSCSPAQAGYLPRSLARSATISLIEAATEFGLALGGAG